MDALELLLKIREKLKNTKYEKGRQDGKAVTWRDFTKIIDELWEERFIQIDKKSDNL